MSQKPGKPSRRATGDSMSPIAVSAILWLVVIGLSSAAAGLSSYIRRREPGFTEALVFQLASAVVSVVLATVTSSVEVLGLRLASVQVVIEALLFAAPLSLLVYLVDRAYESRQYLFFQAMSAVELAVIALVAAPVAEELVFRGLIEGYLLATGASTPVAVVVPATLFSISHVFSYASPRTQKPPVTYVALQALYALLAGLLTSYYREATGSILPAITIHAAINLGGLIAQSQTARTRKPQRINHS